MVELIMVFAAIKPHQTTPLLELEFGLETEVDERTSFR